MKKSKETDTPQFIGVCCQVGAEIALKQAIQKKSPHLKPSFSRPGMVTFKVEQAPSRVHRQRDPDLDQTPKNLSGEVVHPLVRASSQFLSRVTPEKISDWLEQVKSITQELDTKNHSPQAPALRPVHFHFWERDRYFPGDEPPGFFSFGSFESFESIETISDECEGSWLIAWAKAWSIWSSKSTDSFLNRVHVESVPPFPFLSTGADKKKSTALGRSIQNGDLVIDVIATDPGQFWCGWHIHSPAHPRDPGGKHRRTLPPDAPSRAYLKVEEAIERFQLPLVSGEVALEVGSAPGGATYALLERGLRVIGIDPGAMAPVCLKNPRFTHIQKSVAAVYPRDISGPVDWLLLDMNTEPNVALPWAIRMWERYEKTVKGLIFTLKLNQWKILDEVPHIQEVLEKRGLTRIRVQQLSQHRQELVLVGMTRKAKPLK